MQSSSWEPRARARAYTVVAFMIAAQALACTAPELPKTSDYVVGSCCMGRGMCLPQAFIEPRYEGLLSSASCGGDAVCVPDELRQLDIPKTCRASINQSEGRCLPACLPSVQARGDTLQRDGCEQFQVCVPCYDPLTGDSTRACALGDDTGAAEPAKTFAPCCGDLGRCVPSRVVPGAQRGQLGADSCQGAGNLCAPLESLNADKPYVPERCVTLGFETEGRCLPACLPDVAAQSQRLGQSTCKEHYLCTPCFDPRTGEPTGSCSLGADPGPQRAATPQETCCGELGHCMPVDLLSSVERARLGTDTCSASDALCAPDELADPAVKPAHCMVSTVGAEGRCLPSCLPEIASQASRLTQEDCPAQHLCSPCVDPVTGVDTGACTLGADSGPAPDPVVFASCCGGKARCVPTAAIADSQRSLLATDSCMAEHLCVPTDLAQDPDEPATACTVSAVGAEGRCLSTCLASVASRKSVLQQDGCKPDQLCAPCYDPITGAASGACALGKDSGPMAPPVTLQTCCGGAGRCTPTAWVPASQAMNLGPDSCADAAGQLCVAPSAALSDPDFVPASCTDERTGGEGRCLPACLPAVAARATSLSRASCADAELCTLCFDPFTGKPSGACSTGADPGPQKPPVVFETCCGSGASASGVCVPAALVPKGAPALPRQTCTDPKTVCAPRALAEDPHAEFPSCKALSGPGACLDSCYLSSTAQLVEPTAGCQSKQNCVSCSALNGIGCAPK